MDKNPKKPKVGDLVIDASELDFLEDLPTGSRLGLRVRQDGYDEVLSEITANQEKFGACAGITQHDIDTLVETEQQIAMIDARLPAARKLAEILEETRAQLDDRTQRLINAIANSVENRADAYGNEELLGRYEKTRVYRSAAGIKAARTRRRNAELAQSAEGDVPDEPDLAPDPAPVPAPDATV